MDSIEGVEGLTRENVSKLIDDFKLYEYSAESAQILLGLKKRVEKSWDLENRVLYQLYRKTYNG